jgi:formylglycine-generating enzyme required for sulfatase activity
MTGSPPDALMSYARFDDENDGAYLTDLRERLSREVRAYTGRPFHIFQDTKDIPWGQPFAQRIDTALATITFFIPILTPSFFQSEFCCSELQKFLAREAALGRSDLVLPVYYISVPALEDLSRRVNDPLAQTIAARQRMDWRELRFEGFDSPQVRRMLAKMAGQIAAAREELSASTTLPEAPPPAKSATPADPAAAPTQQAPPAVFFPEPEQRDEAHHPPENGYESAQLAAPARQSPPAQPVRERPQTSAPSPERKPTADNSTRPRHNCWLLPAGMLLVLLIALLFFAAREWSSGGMAVVELPNGVTMEFVEVPAGSFVMGSSDDDELADDDEKPQHELELPTYWIGKTEVTNAQFRPFVEGDGYTNRDYWTDAGWNWREEESIDQPCLWEDAEWNTPEQPVVCISWYEAVAYARWISTQTGQELRLPTEAEWEKAARGPDGLIYPWGNKWEDGRANTEEAGIGKATPVGSYSDGASPYGALDMAGNVWEWTATKWQNYPYTPEDEWSDGYLAGDSLRALRGGSLASEQQYVRGANRNGFDDNPRDRNNDIGLRLASHSPWHVASAE